MKELERYLNPVLNWGKQLQKITASRTVEVLTDTFAYPIYIEGIENLDATQNLRMEGNKILIFSNHLSWADPLVTMEVIRRNGFEEMAEMTTIIAGVKLQTQIARKFLGQAYDLIPIWSPFTEPKNQEEKDMRFQMYKDALRDGKQKLESGRLVLTYPETTRSRTQQLTIGQPGMTHYLNLVENTFVLPIGIYGTEKILPVGASLPDFHEANVIFGEPIEADEVVKMYKHIQNRQERKQLIMDYFMYRIAECLPESYHGVYAKEYAKAA